MCGYFALVLCLGVLVQGNDITPTTSNEDVYYPSANWSDSFDWKLLKSYSLEPKNVLISPVSLKIVLALLYQGSSGITQQEFQNVLQFSDQKSIRERYRNMLSLFKINENDEYVFNIGSRIFMDSDIKPQQRFASIAKSFFKTDIEITDFHDPLSSSHSVNSWVEKLTNGRIPTLVSPEDVQDAVMIIANAIYFKDAWRNQFPKERSHIGRFYIPYADGFVTLQTPFISTSDKFYYTESDSLDAKLVRLPYKDGRYSMFIVLPNSKDGLPNLMKKINENSLKQALFSLDLQLVELKLPKFKFDFQARLGQTLRNFGLNNMFENTASLPGIARGQNRNLVVSDVIQKSGIAIDEKGSVVYAATEVTINNRFGDSISSFEASHPFMFYIEDESTGTILFVGKIENPLEN